MLAPYQLRLSYQSQRMSLPLGVRLENVTVEATGDPHAQVVLTSPSVRLAPTLGSLIFGAPGLTIAANLYGGALEAVIRQQSNAIKIDFHADSINLEQSQPLRSFGAQLSGLAASHGTLAVTGPDLIQDKGAGALQGQRVTIEVRPGFPRVTLGEVRGSFSLEAGRLVFQDLEAHGGDLEARADGVIRLADPLAASIIAARIYLTPTASGRDHFGLFFNMLPHPPSEGPYDLHGPITFPTIS